MKKTKLLISYMDPSYTPEIFYEELPLLVAFSEQVYLYRPFEPYIEAAGIDPGDIERIVEKGWVVPLFRKRWFDEQFRYGHRNHLYHRPVSSFDKRLRDHAILLDEAFYSTGEELAKNTVEKNPSLIELIVNKTKYSKHLQQLYDEDRKLPDSDITIMTVNRFVNDAVLLFNHLPSATPYMLPDWTDIYSVILDRLNKRKTNNVVEGQSKVTQTQILRDLQKDIIPRKLDIATATRFRDLRLHRSFAKWLDSRFIMIRGEDNRQNSKQLWKEAKEDALKEAAKYEDGIQIATSVITSVGTATLSLLSPVACIIAAIASPLVMREAAKHKGTMGSWMMHHMDPENLAWVHFFLSQSSDPTGKQ